MFDVTVIGGGVIGGLILRELTKYRISACLLEKHGDVAMGASKANSGIVHAGYDAQVGSLKAKFNVLGNAMLAETTKVLGVKYRNNGSLVVAFSEEDLQTLQALKARGEQNGVPQLEIINQDAIINVYPYASITVGQNGKELSDMQGLAKNAFAFSDDGKGVQSCELMKQAMLKAKELGKIIVAHCEDNSLLSGGYIHAGDYAKANGHQGICSESEWGPIKRDLQLVRETGCAYHVCHISCKESVELIRKAKAEGLNVTCETAPHYLILDDSNLQESGNFKI